MKRLELKVPPLLLTLIFGLIIWFLPSFYKVSSSILHYALSSLFFISGVIVAILGVLEFKKEKTTVNPMTPQESNNLVINGIYRFTRNPMYLGFLLWLLALGVLSGKISSLIPIAFFVVYMNRFQIIPEEKALTNCFGESYLDYCKTVRRWI